MQLATMPLENVPMVSLDLETTGLHVRKDRIVQIGAICCNGDEDRFSTLVHPGITIPASSSRIHGITDAMVARSDALPLVLPRLRNYIDGQVILGYNIGFDLAVLDAEAERHGVDWNWTAGLCLRQLATRLIGPESMLMLSDLEALAAYFQVPVIDRHTAIGDATTTLEIYKRMLPRLAEQKIVTLGDAWREVAALDSLRQSTVNAGWVDVAAADASPEKHVLLSRVDPYPYQHRISDLMLRDPLIMPANATLGEAAAVMNDRPTDCVFVGDDARNIMGIISERDIVAEVSRPIDSKVRVRLLPLSQIMSKPVISVQADDFMHVALGRMSRFDIRHLAVLGQDGEVVGWVSSRELVRQRVTGALVVGDRLSTATSADELQDGLRLLPTLSASLTEEGVSGQNVAGVISAQYREALRKASEIAEQRMIQNNQGPPPVDYAVLMLGSAARGESLLAADQDHAIVFANGAADETRVQAEATQRWFMSLGAHISDILDASGIPYCKGKVMSANADWCRSLSSWRHAIGGWVRRANPADLLSVDIFFDFTLVYGSAALAGQLQSAIAGRATQRSEFLKLLASNVADNNGGRTLFGGFKVENGRFNMKANALLPLVETLRVLAISRQVVVRSSAERSLALAERGDIPPEVGRLGDDVAMGLRLILRQQIADIAAGHLPTTMVDLKLLKPSEVAVLKGIVGRVSRLGTLLEDVLFSQK